MVYRYIPILRTKSGEVDALAELSSAAWTKVMPVINMTAKVPESFKTKLLAKMAGKAIALDGSYNYSGTGSAKGFSQLFNALGAGGIPVIPSISLDADAGYLSAVKAAVNKFGSGLVLHVSIGDLGKAVPFVSGQGWKAANIDLVIALGGVADHDPKTFAGYVEHQLKASGVATHGWRSIAINAWSAPKDHGALPAGPSIIIRKEWLIWQLVSSAVGFKVDYSDVGHIHPSLEEVPGYAMAKATVSVRYTVDDYWLNIKGKATTGAKGSPMSTQYRGHAKTLVSTKGFGVPMSWGDSKISEYHKSTSGKAGGRTQWAAILLNRHLSVVAHQLP